MEKLVPGHVIKVCYVIRTSMLQLQKFTWEPRVQGIAVANSLSVKKHRELNERPNESLSCKVKGNKDKKKKNLFFLLLLL